MFYPTYSRRSDPFALMHAMLRDFDPATPGRSAQSVFPAEDVWQGEIEAA